MYALSPERLTNIDMMAFAKFINPLPNLTSLFLWVKEINDISIKYIVEALIQSNVLRVLDLRDNKIGDLGALELVQLLKQSKTIMTLNLRRNRVGDKGAQELFQAFLQNNALMNREYIMHIDLNGNMVSENVLKLINEFCF